MPIRKKDGGLVSAPSSRARSPQHAMKRMASIYLTRFKIKIKHVNKLIGFESNIQIYIFCKWLKSIYSISLLTRCFWQRMFVATWPLWFAPRYPKSWAIGGEKWSFNEKNPLVSMDFCWTFCDRFSSLKIGWSVGFWSVFWNFHPENWGRTEPILTSILFGRGWNRDVVISCWFLLRLVRFCSVFLVLNGFKHCLNFTPKIGKEPDKPPRIFFCDFVTFC